jgi:ribonucleotide reductase alpha subunit
MVSINISSIISKIGMPYLDAEEVTRNVYPKLLERNTISDIEEQIISTTTEMTVNHYDYPSIATYIIISNLHKSTEDNYLKVVDLLRTNVNRKGKLAPIVPESYENFVRENIDKINSAFDYGRDFQISLFGLRTLERSYLKKLVNGKFIERPQHMYMRVAISLHYRKNTPDRMDRILQTYDLISRGFFTHATPTLFNAGTMREQLSSCFLLGIGDDMSDIGECWRDCAIISKNAGGIGINVQISELMELI